MSALQIVLRWMHIVPAVVAGGTTVFSALALLPAVGTLPESQRPAFREAVMSRWRVVVMICIGLLLASGLANFFLYQAPAHRGQPLYHALFGVKFLLAMNVFFLASALTGRSPALERIRVNARYWTAVNAGLVLAILLISGVLRFIPQS